jgi:hypothetical protein
MKSKKVGFKSVYYDVMFVIGDHAYKYFESIPCVDDEQTWKHDFWWKVYQFFILRGIPDNCDMYYTSIPSEVT